MKKSTVAVLDCSDCLYIPNAFSPNADGKNDVFGPIVGCPHDNIDNYGFGCIIGGGQLVYESKTLGSSWDGIYKGQSAPVGTYFYHLTWLDKRDGKTKTIKGDVALVK